MWTRLSSATMSTTAAHMPKTTACRTSNRGTPPSLQSSNETSSSQGVDDSSVGLLSHVPVPKQKKGNHRYEKTDCFAARHVLALMSSLGLFTLYAMRVNLSIALVAMVKTTKKDNASLGNECPDSNNDNTTVLFSSTGEFEWDEATQGYILGAFFYGYICTQLPGGWLATRIGGKNLFGLGVLNTSVLSIVTPFAARWSVYLLIALRVLEGIGEGVTCPAIHAMWGNWAPLWERSKLVAFTYAGCQIGIVIAIPIAGLLCDSDFAGGWPSVFYVFGALGCLWVLAWMLLVSNTPSDHTRITAAERDYIETSIGKKEKEKIPTPWMSILTSPAVWAIAAGHFAGNVGYYTFLTCLPTYMKNILKVNMKENGLLSALPYLVCWIMEIFSGFSADYIREHRYLSTLNTRRLFQTVGCVLPAGLLVVAGYVGCDHVLAVVLFTLIVGLGGLTMSGYNVSHLDIAPRFTGVLYGISNAVGTIPGFAGPALVGYFTNDNQTQAQWRIVFYIMAAVNIIGTLAYVIFVKGHELPWARAPTTEIIVKGNSSVSYSSGGQLCVTSTA